MHRIRVLVLLAVLPVLGGCIFYRGLHHLSTKPAEIAFDRVIATRLVKSEGGLEVAVTAQLLDGDVWTWWARTGDALDDGRLWPYRAEHGDKRPRDQGHPEPSVQVDTHLLTVRPTGSDDTWILYVRSDDRPKEFSVASAIVFGLLVVPALALDTVTFPFQALLYASR